MYCNRLEWLKEQWKKIQWENPELRRCLHKNPHGNSIGCLRGIKDGSKDVAFVDAYHLRDIVAEQSINSDDLILLCPDGNTVNYTEPDSQQKCNFGRVASRALAISGYQDGKWRWQVTKVLLEAQKRPFFPGNRPSEDEDNGLFSKECRGLTPINLVNQTFQAWLGPMFLRSMEGLLQEPGEEC